MAHGWAEWLHNPYRCVWGGETCGTNRHATGCVVKPCKNIFFKFFFLGNTLLGSLVFTTYPELCKQKLLLQLGFRT